MRFSCSPVHPFIRSAVIFLFSFLLFIPQAFATITLRVVAVNPSEESSQAAPIKVYLPVEVKPEDVIYKEDLDIAYDTQQGSYYVFGEYELKPSEVKELEIELKDIWQVEEALITTLRKESRDVLSGFGKTEYAGQAESLRQAIEKKLDEVDGIQRAPASNPSQHISEYRYALGLINSAKNDLVTAKTLLAEVKPKSKTALTWKVILFIIIFLAVLGLGFFIIWQYQVKLEESRKSEEPLPLEAPGEEPKE